MLFKQDYLRLDHYKKTNMEIIEVNKWSRMRQKFA